MLLNMDKSFELSNIGDVQDSTKTKKCGPPPLKDGSTYVNPEEEDQMEIQGFQSLLPCQIVTWLMILLSFGLIRLLFHWKPHWMLICTHRKCKLKDAEKVLLVDQYSQIFVEKVQTIRSPTSSDNLNHYKHENGAHTIENGDHIANGKDLTVGTGVTTTGDSINGGVKVTIDGDDDLLPVVTKSKGCNYYEVDELRFFDNKKVRYLWFDEDEEFFKLVGLDKNVDCSQFQKMKGLSIQQQAQRLKLYGSNSIEVEVQTFVQILLGEILGPFYIFQVFSMILWCFTDYYSYASCIFIMSMLSLISSFIQIRRNQRQLRDTVQDVDAVTVCRANGQCEEIESSRLVPGDVIVISPYGCIMQCDAVLINGNVIVNESMLTGESVPVTKIPLHHDRSQVYNAKEHGKQTLFCGTKVIQTRYYDGGKVKAVVIRTGFHTAKGELVRSIMFPKPVDFRFNRHIYHFLKCLAVLASIGFMYTVVIKYQRHVPFQSILLKALDLITIIIPPALPAAMTIGVVYAQSRLREANIYCISPRSINISGCITCICFDKTGTLTEDDLSFSKVVPITNSRFDLPVKDLSTLQSIPLLNCLASCHSLTLIEGNVIGDPLDKKMFDATGWTIEEPPIDDANKFDLLAPSIVRSPKRKLIDGDNFGQIEVGILRQFPFSSSLQRMSVITRQLESPNFVIYTKGSPEMISSLCRPESLPKDFHQILMQYTEKGYRVLAMAARDLNLSYAKIQRIPREEVECELTFLGLLVMSNVMKPETPFVIETLKTANIRVKMVTGDNMLTSLSVARECRMINKDDRVILLEVGENYVENVAPKLTWRYLDSLVEQQDNETIFVGLNQSVDDDTHVALTGKTFRVLREFYPDLLNKIAVKGTVFSRMDPEQKQQLVELLIDLGYYVGMCGDGANDCGALKAAHAGISLSETEASVASPFTSKTPNISCFPILIQEGRASLVTAFGILKYMACYSMAQFSSVILLYTYYSSLNDMQFLYEDLFLISLFFVFFGRTHSYNNLSKNPPPSSLIGIAPLSSLALQVALCVIFQVLAVIYLWRQPWYVPHSSQDSIDNSSLSCHDNYAVFAVSVFQYISLAFVFSKGVPYRKPIYTNYILTISLIVMTILTVYIVVYPIDWVVNVMEFDLNGVPVDFRLIMVGFALLNFILAYISESFIVDYLIFTKLRAKAFYKRWFRSEALYQRINRETSLNTNWLPSTESTS